MPRSAGMPCAWNYLVHACGVCVQRGDGCCLLFPFLLCVLCLLPWAAPWGCCMYVYVCVCLCELGERVELWMEVKRERGLASRGHTPPTLNTPDSPPPPPTFLFPPVFLSAQTVTVHAWLWIRVNGDLSLSLSIALSFSLSLTISFSLAPSLCFSALLFSFPSC